MAQSNEWQQRADFTIDVSLNDQKHTLDGFERILYTNNSPDTLHFIWFHIWPNAYKNDKTAFSDQLLLNGNTRFYFSSPEERGYINRLDFKVNNVTAELKDHPEHIDIVQVILPTPLPPGRQVTITTPFHVQLPYNFSRGGHEGQSYQVTQWYPKPAVYDAKGWHPMPYLDQGEFYSEFGNYDVSISLPTNYVVAATGELQEAAEREWLLKERTNETWGNLYRRQHRMRNYDTIYHYDRRQTIRQGNSKKVTTLDYSREIVKSRDSISNVTPRSATQFKTISFKAERVHDFAFFADKRYIVDHDTVALASGKVIDLFSFYVPRQRPWWKIGIGVMKETVLTRGEWIGEYPYPTLSIVQGPGTTADGMEYPMITCITPMKNEALLRYTISHEIGHNWFYGILATNERDHPWMDEGMNTFYDNRYSSWKYGKKGEIKWKKETFALRDLERILFQSKAVVKKDQPINSSSTEFSSTNYNLVAYYKTGAWLEYLEGKMGRAAFDTAMKGYYEQWKFRHPSPQDFRNALTKNNDASIDSAFALLDTKGDLPRTKSSATRVGFLFSPKFWSDYVRDTPKSAIVFTPAFGLNNYDKLMIGGLFSNMVLPPPHFQFLLAPMYSTGAKKFAGTGLASYSFYPDQFLQQVDIGVSAATYSINRYTDDDNNKTYLGFYKLVPGIRLTLKEKDPRSTLERYLQFKTFMIGEDGLRFSRDSIFNGVDTVIVDRVGTERTRRTLTQLKLVIENSRVLYPYRGELKLEQGKGFARAAFTGNYFFNYAKGGGLQVRLFGGKFFYTGTKTISKRFETDRYHLNMTGANGYEDYTYSDYFIGRNEFEGLPSQQIMVRDGAFKVRTDLLADKVGRTDDWLIATNFSTSIPSNINPLSILPVKIPLKIFVDVGTYAEAWKRNANTDRFLFDAGLQVPLLKETINIYIPLIYSKVYKDYYQSTIEKKGRFFKTISFSIDISNFSFRKIDPNLSF